MLGLGPDSGSAEVLGFSGCGWLNCLGPFNEPQFILRQAIMQFDWKSKAVWIADHCAQLGPAPAQELR